MSKKYVCLVIDDEENSRLLIEHYINKTGILECLATFEDPLKGLEFLNGDETADILFLDIKMPELNGFDILESMIDPPATILITSHKNFAVEAFEFEVVDFLLKPVAFERFSKAIYKTIAKLENQKKGPISDFFLKANNKMIRLNIRDVLYIQSDSEYVMIHTEKDKYMVYGSLKKLQKKFEGTSIRRIHRSYMVNTSKIDVIQNNAVMIGDEYIPISKSYQESFYDELDRI